MGVIDVLARAGVRPDLLVGTSVGALNAAFWAFHLGPRAGEQLLDVWLRVDQATFMGGSPVSALPRLLTRGHLFETGRLERLMRSVMPEGARIEASPVPLRIAVTQAVEGGRESLDRGSVVDAMLASCAVAGLFPARELGSGNVYFDGGLVANCDLDAVEAAGVRQAVVVDLLADGFSTLPGDLPDTLMRAVTFGVARQTEMTLARYESRLTIAVLRLRQAEPLRVDDFSRTRMLFELGREAGERLLSRNLDVRRGRVVPGTLVVSDQPSARAPGATPPAPATRRTAVGLARRDDRVHASRRSDGGGDAWPLRWRRRRPGPEGS